MTTHMDKTMPHYGRRDAVASLAFALLAVMLLAPGLASSAFAQRAEFQRSYIDPFPHGDRYRIVVFGDSLADGLWQGLYRAFEEDKNIEVVNNSKPSSGFARPDRYDWVAALDDLLKDQTYQIAVVMFGDNEMQTMKSGKDVIKPGTDAWDDLYGKRVEQFVKKLRGKGIAVYWVGLPIMRSPDDSDDAEDINQIFREKTFINGAKFIDTWSGFTDESGRYSAVGPDMAGQVRRLRADDGVHFTERGDLKLAHFPEKEIRRDLNLAKLERNIPLAGSEDEQAKVMGRAVAPGPQLSEAGEIAEAPADGTEQPAAEIQQSKVGEVDVVRPVISSTALEAAQSMTPQGVAASLTDAENIASDLPDGLTALASISSIGDPSVASSKPRLPLTQRPYYKVLIQGEQLKPKAGRGDDFAWPRS
jgi:hypothetical protein